MLGPCKLGLSSARGDLGHEIVNSRLVIQRQGGWPPTLGRGLQGWGAPQTLSVPDGKLRAIGHMSKAMTGEGRGWERPRGLFCAYNRGRQGPGTKGMGVPEAAARTRDTEAG